LLSELIQYIQPNSLILGGKISLEICSLLSEKGIKYIDYYNEELQIANALPTAEGAIGLALCEMPITISDANVLIVGYGRIAKVLAFKLKLLGAHVTVAARKNTDLVTAKTYGYDVICIQDGFPATDRHIDVIFNTVPACLFGREELKNFDWNTLYIELASAPYGINAQEAERLKIRVIMAQSLPGKYSPVTAGKILAETIVRILEKEENLP
jgi:dipicolinate synthase subunit A